MSERRKYFHLKIGSDLKPRWKVFLGCLKIQFDHELLQSFPNFRISSNTIIAKFAVSILTPVLLIHLVFLITLIHFFLRFITCYESGAPASARHLLDIHKFKYYPIPAESEYYFNKTLSWMYMHSKVRKKTLLYQQYNTYFIYFNFLHIKKFLSLNLICILQSMEGLL